MTRPDPVYRVTFVCTGNTCRSPMAVAALRRALGADGERVAIESAGTGGIADLCLVCMSVFYDRTATQMKLEE